MGNISSIDPRERRAELDSKYNSIIKQEANNVSIWDVQTLVTDLIALNFHGGKKDLGSNYASRSKKILDRFGYKLEEDKLRRIQHSEIIASCFNKWFEGLKRLGIKQINVGAQYDNIGLDMISSKSVEIKKIHDIIFNDFLENRNYELSYNQMCNAFNLAATRLGILRVDRVVNYKRLETIRSVNKVDDSQQGELEVVFESGWVLTLNYLSSNDIKDGDYFEVSYSDPHFNRHLETTLRDSSWRRKKSWVSQEYIDNQDSDRSKSVIVL